MGDRGVDGDDKVEVRDQARRCLEVGELVREPQVDPRPREGFPVGPGGRLLKREGVDLCSLEHVRDRARGDRSPPIVAVGGASRPDDAHAGRPFPQPWEPARHGRLPGGQVRDLAAQIIDTQAEGMGHAHERAGCIDLGKRASRGDDRRDAAEAPEKRLKGWLDLEVHGDAPARQHRGESRELKGVPETLLPGEQDGLSLQGEVAAPALQGPAEVLGVGGSPLVAPPAGGHVAGHEQGQRLVSARPLQRRIDLKSAAVAAQGAVHVVQRKQRRALIVVSLRVVGPRANRAPVAGQRPFGEPLGLEDHSQIVEAAHVVRVDAEGPFVGLRGLGKSALLSQHVAEVEGDLG